MRILHTADWHLGKSLEGNSRLKEQEAFLEELAGIVEEEQIQLVLIAGDIYDSVNPPAQAEVLFYDTMKRLSGNGKRMILVIAGNHDNPDRLTACGPLAKNHGVLLAGIPGQVIPVGKYGQNRVTESGPGYVKVQIGQEEGVILMLPYPSEKRLNQVLFDSSMGEEERAESYAERVRELFCGLQEHFSDNTVNLAVTHLFTLGSEEAGSERNIQLGGSYLVDGSCLPMKAQYIALGHIHKSQKVKGTNERARYSGSPIHYSKNEIAHEKKVLIVDVKAGQEAVVTEHQISAYKPIQVWRAASIEQAIEECERRGAEDSYVYLEVLTDRYIREDEIKQMKLLKKDILSIMPVIQSGGEDREREERSEQSFEETFRQFYEKERGTAPDEELMELLGVLLGGEEQ